jgi:hypothetical protein
MRKRLHTYSAFERSAAHLIREETHEGKKVYICSCGLGYEDILIAYACDEYVRTHGVTSEDIIKRAVYNPRTMRSPEPAIRAQ